MMARKRNHNPVLPNTHDGVYKVSVIMSNSEFPVRIDSAY